ncbi:MAG: hypothetical protein HZC29_08675 [Thaumarchaeota archaeon]|nr:hypothetical protein [Nitrososphaerota archaeon]
MGLSDKSEYKYTIETSNDNAQGVFKVRVVPRSDELKISKTLEEANDIRIEEQNMAEFIAELVNDTYTQLKEKGFKIETEPKQSKEKPITTSTKGQMRPESEVKDTSLLLDNPS